MSFMVLLGSAPAPALGGEAEIARFHREYPKALKQLETSLARARGTCRITNPDHRGPRPGRLDSTFVADHGYKKMTMNRKPPKAGLPKAAARRWPVDIVFCQGNGTGFKLYRFPDADEYVLAASGMTPENYTEFIDQFGCYYDAPYAVHGIPLTKIMEHPKFRVISAEELVEAGRKLFRIEYEDTYKKTDRGMVVFDPGLGWAVVRSELHPGFKPEAKLTTEVEYGPARDGVPFPKAVVVRGTSNPTRCEFRDVDFGPTPEREFTPEYYKLPGLKRAAGSAPNRLPFAVGGIAALGLGGSALVLKLAGRPAARPA